MNVIAMRNFCGLLAAVVLAGVGVERASAQAQSIEFDLYLSATKDSSGFVTYNAFPSISGDPDAVNDYSIVSPGGVFEYDDGVGGGAAQGSLADFLNELNGTWTLTNDLTNDMHAFDVTANLTAADFPMTSVTAPTHMAMVDGDTSITHTNADPGQFLAVFISLFSTPGFGFVESFSGPATPGSWDPTGTLPDGGYTAFVFYNGNLLSADDQRVDVSDPVGLQVPWTANYVIDTEAQREFKVIPEPTSLVLVGLGVVAMLRRR